MNGPENWLAFGGVAAIIAAAWSHIKSIWDYLRSFIVLGIKMVDAKHEGVVFNYLWRHYPHTCLSSKREIVWSSEPLKATGRYEEIIYDSRLRIGWIFWINHRPLFWNRGSPAGSNPGSDHRNGAEADGSVTWLRGTVDIDKLLRDSMKEYRAHFRVADYARAGERFQVYTLSGDSGGSAKSMYGHRGGNSVGGAERLSTPSVPLPSGTFGVVHQMFLETAGFFNHTLDEFGRTSAIRGLDTLALDDASQALVEECDRWLRSEEWFRERGVPWRRGVLLYGGPGTGKTSLLRAIAEFLDVPIFVLDLGTMNNQELKQNWSSAVTSAPCMVAIEDIDGIFHGRENTMGENGGGLTFDALLNTIDGLDRANGVLLAITTNRIDKVDPALGRPIEGTQDSTRPGRIDRVIEMLNPDEDGRRKIALRILRDWPDMIEQVVMDGSLDSGAQFQNRCTVTAQDLFWKDRA